MQCDKEKNRFSNGKIIFQCTRSSKFYFVSLLEESIMQLKHVPRVFLTEQFLYSQKKRAEESITGDNINGSVNIIVIEKY